MGHGGMENGNTGIGHGDTGSGAWRHREWGIGTEGVGMGTLGLVHGDIRQGEGQ